MDTSRHDRHQPAHPDVHVGGPIIVFLTVCTKNRAGWLATDPSHALLRTVWTESAAWLVGRYVIMPDHIHLFAAPGLPELPLDNWIRYWKSQFSKRCGDPAQRWQTGHWDRQLRHGESCQEKWEYIVNNPVRKGLVVRSEDWPHQGEIFELFWR
jgi:putative transposase